MQLSKKNKTITFSTAKLEKEMEMKSILTSVYDSLKEKGYDPINQIVGYILSEDPTYITNYNNARALIRKIDRDELMRALVSYYLQWFPDFCKKTDITLYFLSYLLGGHNTYGTKYFNIQRSAFGALR